MRSLMRRGKAEAAPLNPEPDSSIIDAANATIAELRDNLDDRAEQIVGLHGRCDELFAANRLLREENVRKAVTITDLRKGIDQAASQRHAIDEALSTVPGLSQSHGNDQAADVAELVMRYLELGRRGEAADEENVTLREALAGYAPDPRIAAMTAALERFAAPGVITATDRRKAATDALGAAQGDAEATP